MDDVHWSRITQGTTAWLCYYLLGAGVLAPWNAFITAVDYFEAVFPGMHTDRLFTVCYLPTCLVMIAVMMRYNTPHLVRGRILIGFTGFTLLMLLVPLLDAALIAGAAPAPAFALVLVLASVLVLGVLDGVCQGAIWGETAALPSKYTHAVVSGTASSGLLICLLRIVTKAALPADVAGLRTSTALYFAAAGAISLACLLVYALVLPGLRAALWDDSRSSNDESTALLELQLSAGSTSPLDNHAPPKAFHFNDGGGAAGGVPGVASLPSTHAAAAASAAGEQPHSLPPHTKAASPYDDSAAADRSALPPRSWQQLAAIKWELGVANVLVYTVTLSIFPGFLAEDVQSAALRDWYPILLITAFNLADLVGKSAPLPPLRGRCAWVLRCALARLLFLPLYLVVTKTNPPPPLVTAATLALGLTNGYLTAAVMTAAPLHLPAYEAELLENVMVLCLVGGLALGAVAGWAWLWLL